MPFRFSRAFFLLLAASSLSLTACKKDSEDAASGAGDGSVTWTHNGTTYTSKLTASAIVDPGDKIIITGASADNNNVVSLGLFGINAHGASVYDLRRGSTLDDLPVAGITLNASTAGQGTIFNTIYAPSASNGNVTVTQYDKAAQKISGTFTFTAGPVPGTPATGTQTVTNGSFSFTKFH